RVDGVGQAPLLPDLPEEPRGHAAAHDVIEDLEGPSPLVRAVEPWSADDQMGLLGVASGHPQAGGEVGRGVAVAHGVTPPVAEPLGDHPDDLVVMHRAGRRHDHRARAVATLPVARDVVAGHGPDRVPGAEHRPLQAVPGEDLHAEVLVGDVARVVVRHVDLLDDDLTLRLDLVRGERGALEELGEHVEARAQVLVQQPRRVAGGFLRGEGVGLGPDGVEGLGNLWGGEVLRALEEQMLEEVGYARLVAVLVPGAGVYPAAQCDRSHRGHPLGDDPETVGQGCQLVMHMEKSRYLGLRTDRRIMPRYGYEDRIAVSTSRPA